METTPIGHTTTTAMTMIELAAQILGSGIEVRMNSNIIEAHKKELFNQ